MTVGSARWPDREWGVASRKDAVDRVDSVGKVVDDERSLGPLANGTAVERVSPDPAERGPVNGYDHIMDSLRTAALRRDAAVVREQARTVTP